MEELQEGLARALGSVLYMDQKLKKEIKSIIMKAANLWLEFGSQPYRIAITLDDLGLLELRDRIESATGGDTTFIIVPGLRRNGTHLGHHLDVETVIVDDRSISVPLGSPGRSEQ